MCGIAGLHVLDGEIDRDELLSMRDRQTHRGPDDAGLWIGRRGKLGLAHRRLSIIDLSDAGHQPMISEDGMRVLAFNGEIYNFRQLREELRAEGHQFSSSSDTEVVLRSYEAWGIAALERFNGMFAFALYDERSEKLFIARDRFGEKPLYYSRRNGRFLFASELKALSVAAGFSSCLAQQQLHLYLTFGYIPYPHTIFEDIFKLPPAHVLCVDMHSQDIEVRPYWDLAKTRAHSLPSGQVVDELEQGLATAVRERLVADVPVGAFLSGGIDSSLVVSMIAREKTLLKTFSVGFKEGPYDEAPHARRIAEYLGCEHYEHYVSAEEAQEVLVQLPSIYDEPFADSSAIPTYIVSKFAREHVKVVLSGDGGDELFSGYATYPHLMRAMPLLLIPDALRSPAGRLLRMVGRGRMRRHSELLEQRELWELFLYLNERTIAKKSDVERLLVDPAVHLLQGSPLASSFATMKGRGALQSALYADIKTYLVEDNLVKVDRASMAVSLEVRIPFLDHNLAEFAMGLSERTKAGFWRQQQKPLLRQVLSRYLPRELFERPKRGFSVPLAQWLRGDLRWLLERYLDRDRLGDEGLFDTDFVQELVGEHLSGRRDRNAVLWALIFWQMWRDKWNC